MKCVVGLLTKQEQQMETTKLLESVGCFPVFEMSDIDIFLELVSEVGCDVECVCSGLWMCPFYFISVNDNDDDGDPYTLLMTIPFNGDANDDDDDP